MSYLLVCWPREASTPAWLDALIGAVPADWATQIAAPNVLLARGGGFTPAVRVSQGGVLIGEVFGRPDGFDRAAGDDAARARGLCDQVWGSYVALLVGEGGAPSVFRDPSGGLDCLVWRAGEASLIADDLPAWLDPWRPARLALDWDQVAAMLCDPVVASSDAALCGVEGIAPGTLWSASQGRRAIWTPAQAARRPAATRTQALDGLPHLVDEVVGTLAGKRTLIELSGGLDSAIIASALRARGKDAEGLNYFSLDLGGDERAYARAVAHLNGMALTEVCKPSPSLDLDALAAVASGVRPGFNALDFEHDQDVAERCGRMGADTLMTGQGGDHVFFQAPTALTAADAMGRGLGVGVALVLARRLGRSVWSILGQALGARFDRAPLQVRPSHLSVKAWESAAGHAAHPWLEDIGELAPAKALQAACLAAALSLQGASRRGRAARLRHPLLSQPVMEFCLPIPVNELTFGGHDRAMARAAFASRLPACVAARQGKGRLTSHYGRAIASGLGDLRPLLLEGRLAQERLLDVPVVDHLLRRENLAWRGGYGAIMGMVAVELWVRSWEERLNASHVRFRAMT